MKRSILILLGALAAVAAFAIVMHQKDHMFPQEAQIEALVPVAITSHVQTLSPSDIADQARHDFDKHSQDYANTLANLSMTTPQAVLAAIDKAQQQFILQATATLQAHYQDSLSLPKDSAATDLRKFLIELKQSAVNAVFEATLPIREALLSSASLTATIDSMPDAVTGFKKALQDYSFMFRSFIKEFYTTAEQKYPNFIKEKQTELTYGLKAAAA